MERTNKSKPQTLLALLAMAFVVTAIWAATALALGGSSAGGSSSASSDSTGSQPAAEFVQSEDDAAPAAEDCPEGDGSSGGGSGDSDSGSTGSSASDL